MFLLLICKFKYGINIVFKYLSRIRVAVKLHILEIVLATIIPVTIISNPCFIEAFFLPPEEMMLKVFDSSFQVIERGSQKVVDIKIFFSGIRVKNYQYFSKYLYKFLPGSTSGVASLNANSTKDTDKSGEKLNEIIIFHFGLWLLIFVLLLLPFSSYL